MNKMSDRVRAAIEGCGTSRYQIAKATGISQSSLSRFVASGRGLSVEALDKLFEYLDLDVTARRRKQRPTKRDTSKRGSARSKGE